MDLSRLGNIFMPSAFAEPAALDPAAMYADAVVHLLIEDGPNVVTMGAVARWMRQVPSAVKQRAEGRDGFLRMVVGRFAHRWLRWLSRGVMEPIDLVRLPESDDEVHGLRVWSCLSEIAAGEARAGRSQLVDLLAGVRDRRREVVDRDLTEILGRRPDRIEVTLIECLGDALRASMAAPVDPLDLADARQVVAWVTDRLLRSD